MLFFVDFDHSAAVVIATAGAGSMREFQLLAFGANAEVRRGQGVVAATAVAPSFG